ncbi:MAG: hypothetical protein R2792_11850 [Saprospiraceae bacterium]
MNQKALPTVEKMLAGLFFEKIVFGVRENWLGFHLILAIWCRFDALLA